MKRLIIVLSSITVLFLGSVFYFSSAVVPIEKTSIYKEITVAPLTTESK